MSKYTEYIGSQFGNPRGFIGKCCCLLMNAFNQAMYREVVNTISLTERSRVLDVGFGNGRLIEQIYNKFRPNVYGIDISEDMKKIALQRNQKALQSKKMHLQIGNCCDMDFEAEYFDAVTSINTIYFWDDTLTGLKEIKRVLKNGGTFYNVMYSKEWLQKLSYTKKGFRLFEKDELLRLGKEAGYLEVVIKDIVNGKSYLIEYRK